MADDWSSKIIYERGRSLPIENIIKWNIKIPNNFCKLKI
jgi:hypothetical protein